MRRRVARACLISLVAAEGLLLACSSGDDDSTGEGASGSSGSSSAGGTKPHAGSSATGGADGTGASSQGGASNHAGNGSRDGGAPPQGMAGETSTAGSGTEAGGPGSMAGAGGTAGETEPPDLITATGGPWPDSLTGTCANATQQIPCPQTDAPFFGQDGTYRINVPTYKATSTTMKDSVTGLVWQVSPPLLGQTQAVAAKYCDDLSFAGQTDWRLPTRLEYISVLDEGKGSGYAMPSSIPLETTGVYWTASASGKTAGSFFVIDDNAGAWNISVGENETSSARCVRGTPLSGTLAVDTDVVTDSMTKLVWQATELDDGALTWQKALEYCETLSHAGKDDWRLPNIKELATLVDEAATLPPVIAADFGAGMAAAYWSSTPALGPNSERFAFALDTGLGISPSLKVSASAAAARCVRSAD